MELNQFPSTTSPPGSLRAFLYRQPRSQTGASKPKQITKVSQTNLYIWWQALPHRTHKEPKECHNVEKKDRPRPLG